jgi:hypothetical protein
MKQIKAGDSAELKTDNKVGDVIDKENIFKGQKMSDKQWSSYPLPMPGKINADMVQAVRTRLNDINNKTLLSYSCAPNEARDDQKFELGVLQCYDGVSEGREANFLSCDFVNPEYVDELKIGKERSENLQIKRSIPQWLSNKSCFVYAPVGSLLSQTEGQGQGRAPIALSLAQKNWEGYANGSIELPKMKSPHYNVGDENILPGIWLYTEEFVEYVNKDKNFHKTYQPIQNKGRIGMMFPITPMRDDEVQEEKLKLIQVGLDHVGWGKVGAVHGEKLESDYKPRTWDDLQSKIGRYILLTNIWSSTDDDPYRSEMQETVMQKIYDRVYEMTTGKMIVNVRRGSNGYGRLCVVQKKI